MADDTGEAGRGCSEEVRTSRLSSSTWGPDFGDLERARAHLAAIVDSSEDGIISKTLEGIITSWNRGAQAMFGYTAEEVIGQPVTLLIPPDHLDEEPAILERMRRGDRIEHYETVRRRKDGILLNVSEHAG